MMKVRATAVGYYGGMLRKPGDRRGRDVFELVPRKLVKRGKDGKLAEVTVSPEEQFSTRWMERIDPPHVSAPSKKAAKGSSDNEAL